MKLAILFWFYKEQEICENRLKLLRKYNPEINYPAAELRGMLWLLETLKQG